ncbi:MAG: hypothetical protein A3K19_13895 [Lentisphaerae bacterium RIFOXYB12_FULL_65_16]|nr:MAG: hypothetical protein A3K18_18050 [Lentisphaerae bacterium RIFOXYA12_64_32]OGV94128.1 MAG: hypothetical protein A3K19_13895 [Lentisphaerae bacterium RIFOXYB12_FULL_65_16]
MPTQNISDRLHTLTGTYQVIDPRFGRPTCPIELDMGCGKGRFTLALADRHPDRLILGSDIMLGRLRKVAVKADRRGLRNLELLRASNLELAGYQIPDASVRRVHLLCPDPWPKARHRHNRFVTTDFLTRLARILEPDGILHLATDHLPYLDDIRRIVADLPLFCPAPAACDDIRDIKTDFELLWEAEGRTVPHLVFVRAPSPA